MKNIITFDLESWYESINIKDKTDLVLEPTKFLLSLLKKTNVKATFFVLGKIVKKYPDLIKDIYHEGHEIASHSYTHRKIDFMKKEEFKKEVIMSKKIIKKVIKENPKGFRAPMWSIKNKNNWALRILEKNGFLYDSSLFPINTKFYGVSNIPNFPYHPSFHNLRRIDNSNKILEVPIIPFNFYGVKVPFSGGVYFRILSIKLINLFTKKLNKKNKRVVFYFHPWEFIEKTPKIKISLMGKIITSYKLKDNLKKLKILLRNNKFTSMQELID